MTTKIPKAIADLELSLASSVSVGATSFTLSASVDDDGTSLPTGLYCFTIDSGTSNKEYLIGQVNGVNVTSVKSVSRQGVETTGATKAHRVGAPCIVTDFAVIQRVADVLNGDVALNGASPIIYDAEPTLADRKELATVGYVLDTASGGTVTFDSQTVAGTAGATFAAGDLIYLDEADQEWKLCDADTAATVEGVMRGIALGSGSDGVAITGGVHLAGVYTTTGLTAGAIYYASNTAGGLSTSAGTTKHIVGVALSTTRLWVIPQHRETISTRTKDALAGGGNFGTPSTSNKFITQDYNSSATGLPVIRTYLNSGSPHTWTKPAGLKYVVVEGVGAGGGGGGGTEGTNDFIGGGGGAGGYFKKIIPAASLGSTETVTVGAGGAGGSGVGAGTNGSSGGNTSFGSHATGNGGSGGILNDAGGAGGTATGGDINIQGGNGWFGGSATTSSGNVGWGAGGLSILGNGTPETNSAGTGATGRDYGSGGSGGNGTSGDASGGPGAQGIVIVTEYYS